LFDKAIWSYMKAGSSKFVARISCSTPSFAVPQVASAAGDCAKVDWTKASGLVKSWSRQASSVSWLLHREALNLRCYAQLSASPQHGECR
jgi:hypothetical protein